MSNYNTPTKNTKSVPKWDSTPSPTSLQTMYLNTPGKLDELKNEVKNFMRRLLTLVFENDIRAVLLDEDPLTTHYELFHEMLKERENNRNRACKNFIIISDSSASASISENAETSPTDP